MKKYLSIALALMLPSFVSAAEKPWQPTDQPVLTVSSYDMDLIDQYTLDTEQNSSNIAYAKINASHRLNRIVSFDQHPTHHSPTGDAVGIFHPPAYRRDFTFS